MSKKVIDLNIVTTYPVKWDMYKILRDYIQNFYDSVPNNQFMQRFSYDYKDETLTMRCSNVSFSYEWLLHIGASTKTMDKENSYAGYFGEGFKIASLCAMRDYKLKVLMFSSNWKIQVIEREMKVDSETCKCLSYELETFHNSMEETYLELMNFKEDYLEYFYCALYSFYYEENPLFGDKIYCNDRCSIFHRSIVKKNSNYPISYKSIGDGIIFAGRQARGSIKEPIIFCYHEYNDNDRDRSFFSDIDNIDIIVRCVQEMPSHIAMKVLIIFKKLWYTYPEEKFGYRSYYTVIKNLVLKMRLNGDVVQKFVDEYPKLLYATKLSTKDIRSLNERKYCLEWLKENPQYTLVQDTFRYIGIKSLEKKGEEENILPIISGLTIKQMQYTEVLKKCINEVFQGFFEHGFPECASIINLRASVSGYASLTPLKKRNKNNCGHIYRYGINKICIKEIHLQKQCFYRALTVIIHELCHTFGGDKSENFSYAVTDALEIVLNNRATIEKYKNEWERIGN